MFVWDLLVGSIVGSRILVLEGDSFPWPQPNSGAACAKQANIGDISKRQWEDYNLVNMDNKRR